jgi:small-conductance mechanosensitive channel
LLTGWLEHFAAWAERVLGVAPDLASRLLLSLIVVATYVVVRRGAIRLVVRRLGDPTSRYQLGKVVNYGFGVLALALLGRIWIQGVSGLATYLGLLSAGIAFALQDPLMNLAGWLFLVVRRPFEVGDRIQIGPHSGDVVDIRLFQFVILEIGNWVQGDQSTGRIIYLPNGWIFKHPQASYNKGFGYIWNEIAVTVTFESDWRRAKDVLTQAINEHAEHLTTDAAAHIAEAAHRYHIKFSKLTPVVWTNVVDSGVRLTMRYLCKPRERRASEHEIWEAVLDAFSALPSVDFAYPTTRRFDNAFEGKAAARSRDSQLGFDVVQPGEAAAPGAAASDDRGEGESGPVPTTGKPSAAPRAPRRPWRDRPG